MVKLIKKGSGKGRGKGRENHVFAAVLVNHIDNIRNVTLMGSRVPLTIHKKYQRLEVLSTNLYLLHISGIKSTFFVFQVSFLPGSLAKF